MVALSTRGPVNGGLDYPFDLAGSGLLYAGDPPSVVLPTISVVIPALNEAANLPHVLPRIPSWAHEVVLVDGHSTDGTLDVAREVWPNHHIVTREQRYQERRRVVRGGLDQDRRGPGTVLRLVTQERRGKGAALRAGFAAATGDIIVTLDADGSMDGAEIIRFVSALLDGADFAKGSRFLPGAGSADITRFRRAGNTVFTKLTNVLYGTSYTDITYGYNAFWSRYKSFLDIPCDGFSYEILVNCRTAKNGLRVAEVPSYEQVRLHGASKLNTMRDGMAVLRVILGERWGLVAPTMHEVKTAESPPEISSVTAVQEG
jgi:glycosyltransferase involved in cell wall biosynthesis